MPFKKNSPGCLCCGNNVWAYGTGGFGTLSPFYWPEQRNTGGTQLYADNTGKDPSLYKIIGANIDDKYFLVFHIDTGEIRQFNPSDRTDIGVLWGAGTDVALYVADSQASSLSGNIAGEFYYSSTWEMGYAIFQDPNLLSGQAAQASFSVDGTGTFIKGPYVVAVAGTYSLKDLTMKENGDLYLHGPDVFSIPYFYEGFYVNEDMEAPLLSANHTFKSVDPKNRPSGPQEQYFQVHSLFSDGLIQYVYLIPSTGSEDDFPEGIYTLSDSGVIDFVTAIGTIHDDLAPDNANAYHPIVQKCIYTPSQERWQMGVYNGEFNGWWAWVDLEFVPQKYLKHLMGQQFNTSLMYYNSHMLVIRPIDIEDYWDAM